MHKKSMYFGCFAVIAALFLTASPASAADISGEWNWVSYTEGGERPTTPVFQLTGDTVSGKWDGADVKGTFVGDHLSLIFPFTSREGGISGTLKLEGKLADDVLTGTWAFAEYSGTFRATRKKASASAAVAAGGVAGAWQCEIQAADRVHQVKMIVADEGGKLTGKIAAEDREVTMLTPKLESGVLSFQVEVGSSTLDFQLKPDGDKIAGSWKSGERSGTVKGTRAGI